MINEEIIGQSVEVGFRISKLSLDLILKGLDFLIKKLEEKPGDKTPDAHTAAPDAEPELKHGKQTLKELHKHNEGLATMELKDPNLRDLYKEMRKKDIDFSCVKDGKGKYTLLFKGKNAEEMTSAFKKYTEKMVVRADIQTGKKTARDDKQAKRTAAREEKQSIRAELKQAKIDAKALEAGRGKVKNRGKGAIEH